MDIQVNDALADSFRGYAKLLRQIRQRNAVNVLGHWRDVAAKSVRRRLGQEDFTEACGGFEE